MRHGPVLAGRCAGEDGRGPAAGGKSLRRGDGGATKPLQKDQAHLIVSRCAKDVLVPGCCFNRCNSRTRGIRCGSRRSPPLSRTSCERDRSLLQRGPAESDVVAFDSCTPLGRNGGAIVRYITEGPGPTHHLVVAHRRESPSFGCWVNGRRGHDSCARVPSVEQPQKQGSEVEARSCSNSPPPQEQTIATPGNRMLTKCMNGNWPAVGVFSAESIPGGPGRMVAKTDRASTRRSRTSWTFNPNWCGDWDKVIARSLPLGSPRGAEDFQGRSSRKTRANSSPDERQSEHVPRPP